MAGRDKSAKQGFRNPHNLPVKTCPVCQRPFAWRKKWAANWEAVLYCSQACRAKSGPGRPHDTDDI